ncbi:MAG: alpha-tubulin suppressor-like RCC1 family protein [Glaciecola sp.]|jgi:alpha-tubulin suppressor-like RCC1 family protein
MFKTSPSQALFAFLFTLLTISVNGQTIFAGSSRAFLIKEDLTVWAWGSNSYGSYGSGLSTNYDLPTQITTFNGITDIGVGTAHTVFLKSDGTVLAAGNNLNGQLGDGTNTSSSAPVSVLIDHVTAVSSSYNHTLFLKDDGTVWSVGQNLYGQLGDSSLLNRNTPVKVKNVDSIVAVSAGSRHSLFLKSDGTVWATGSNSNSGAGTGSIGGKIVPVKIPSLNNVKAVATGVWYSLFLKHDGTVWGTGQNSSGRLGDGTTSTRWDPIEIPNIDNVVAISAHSSHSLFLKSDGTAWSCGYNSDGQLGNGSTANGLTVQQVLNLPVIAQISAGNTFSLFQKDGCYFYGAGSNSFGMMANGTSTEEYTTPVAALTTCSNTGTNTDTTATIVYIPDSLLKKTLIEERLINLNWDSEISVQEAASYSSGIVVTDTNITDLTGLEAFKNINSLEVYASVDSVNLNDFKRLKRLVLGGRSLKGVDLSPVDSIGVLSLLGTGPDFKGIDLSSMHQLFSLELKDTRIEHLDISVLPGLKNVFIWDCSRLEMLDFSKNDSLFIVSVMRNIKVLSLDFRSNYNEVGPPTFLEMPLLTCISVKDTAYANTHWTLKDSTITYMEDCSVNCPSFVVSASGTTINPLCGDSAIHIKDQNLLNAILAYTPPIDTNGDSIITYNEALAVDSLNLSFQNILLFTGLEAFKNLKSINISNNLLASLDVSQLIYLQKLIASNNQIASLITFTNSNAGGRRSGTENDVLQELDLSNNNFENLDVSIFSSLDSFDGSGNSNLQEICVTQEQVNNKVGDWSKDASTSWSTNNCARVTSTLKSEGLTLTLYPNPNTGTFTIMLDVAVIKVNIYHHSGRLVKTITPSKNQKSIEIQLEKSGVYFVHVQSNSQKEILKVVVVK